MLGFGLIYAHILAKKRVGSGDLGSKARKVFKSNRTVRAIMAFLYSVGTQGCSVSDRFIMIYVDILAKKRVGSGDLGSKARKVFKSNRTVRAIMAFLYSVGTHGCSVLNNFGAHSGEKASR